MTDPRQDPVTQAARKVREAIDRADVLPAEGRGLLRDLADRAESAAHALAGRAEDVVHVAADRAEDVVHAAADRGRDLAETAGIAALEASDRLRRRAERRTRQVALVGAGLVTVLTVLLVASRRR